MRGKSGGEDWCKGGNRSVHQPGKPRLHPGEDELAFGGQVLVIPGTLRQMGFLKPLGVAFVTGCTSDFGLCATDW